MELPQEIKSAGAHELSFNQKNLSSGIYFYTIQAKSVDGTGLQGHKEDDSVKVTIKVITD